MDLLSWITGTDPEATPRSNHSHGGIYRRPDAAPALQAKGCNPGIYSRRQGPFSGGCLAGMRAEPIEEFSPNPVRTTRSLSPQKARREPFPSYQGYGAQYHDVRSVQPTTFRPASIGSEAQGSFFNAGGYYSQSHRQAQAPGYEAPERLYGLSLYQQFQGSFPYQQPSIREANFTQDVKVPAHTAGTDDSRTTTPSKNDATPSTSDHSDVDDLVPRSIHSPSISDSQTPPSSTPGSPTAPGERLPAQDAGSNSDSSEKPNPVPVKEDASSDVNKPPFASLDIQDKGVAKARKCVQIAQQLNKSVTSECRSLEDEMSDLTKDLEALRAQLKNRPGA